MPDYKVPKAGADVTINELISFLSEMKIKHGNIYVDCEYEGSGTCISSAHIVKDPDVEKSILRLY